jgi:transcriptional regulator with XRE-family HTH domain
VRLDDDTIMNVTSDTPEAAESKPSASRASNEATWSGRITKAVARRIRRWREDIGLSAQQLSERTRELGFEVPRTVIANLENGRRETLSVAEFLVISAALDIPPVLLLADIGHEDTVEILPGRESTAWLARGWILGAADPVRYEPRNDERWRAARRSIVLYDIHKLLVREHQQMRRRLKPLIERAGLRGVGEDPAEVAEADSMLATALLEIDYSLNRIREHRELIRSEGFLEPALPTEVSSEMRASSQVGRHHAPGSAENRSETERRPWDRADESIERPLFFDRISAEYQEKLDGNLG